MLVPVKTWFRHNGTSNLLEFAKGCLSVRSYGDRFYFDDRIDDAVFFERYICSVEWLGRNYEGLRALEEKQDVTALYALIMAEIGKLPLNTT